MQYNTQFYAVLFNSQFYITQHNRQFYIIQLLVTGVTSSRRRGVVNEILASGEGLAAIPSRGCGGWCSGRSHRQLVTGRGCRRRTGIRRAYPRQEPVARKDRGAAEGGLPESEVRRWARVCPQRMTDAARTVALSAARPWLDPVGERGLAAQVDAGVGRVASASDDVKVRPGSEQLALRTFGDVGVAISLGGPRGGGLADRGRRAKRRGRRWLPWSVGGSRLWQRRL